MGCRPHSLTHLAGLLAQSLKDGTHLRPERLHVLGAETGDEGLAGLRGPWSLLCRSSTLGLAGLTALYRLRPTALSGLRGTLVLATLSGLRRTLVLTTLSRLLRLAILAMLGETLNCRIFNRRTPTL